VTFWIEITRVLDRNKIKCKLVVNRKGQRKMVLFALLPSLLLLFGLVSIHCKADWIWLLMYLLPNTWSKLQRWL